MILVEINYYHFCSYLEQNTQIILTLNPLPFYLHLGSVDDMIP